MEDFPCKKEKVDDFVFKLEEVVEMKVAFFTPPPQKTQKCLTMTLTQAKP